MLFSFYDLRLASLVSVRNRIKLYALFVILHGVCLPLLHHNCTASAVPLSHPPTKRYRDAFTVQTANS